MWRDECGFKHNGHSPYEQRKLKMKNMILEQLYYKVENKDCDLFKRANEFLAMEEKLRETQRKTIESELPKFSKYKCLKGFNRIGQYTGFVFDDKENIDPKVWKTK